MTKKWQDGFLKGKKLRLPAAVEVSNLILWVLGSSSGPNVVSTSLWVWSTSNYELSLTRCA